MTGVFDNPAMRNALRDSSLSDVEVGYLGNRNVSEYAQDGEGWNGWNAGGDAFIRISGDMVAWGGASYEKGLRMNVYLAESSDYMEVLPMAVADTAYADKEREAYEFNAGFAWEGRCAGVGLQIDYSSACEYRTTTQGQKPTPSWRVSDLVVFGKLLTVTLLAYMASCASTRKTLTLISITSIIPPRRSSRCRVWLLTIAFLWLLF